MYIFVYNQYILLFAALQYGPTGTYKAFGGRDVTVALSIPCTTAACVAKTLNRPYTAFEQKSIDRWLEFFTQHDKYKLIGRLIALDPVDVYVDVELLSENDTAVDTAHTHTLSGVHSDNTHHKHHMHISSTKADHAHTTEEESPVEQPGDEGTDTHTTTSTTTTPHTHIHSTDENIASTTSHPDATTTATVEVTIE